MAASIICSQLSAASLRSCRFLPQLVVMATRSLGVYPSGRAWYLLTMAVMAEGLEMTSGVMEAGSTIPPE